MSQTLHQPPPPQPMPAPIVPGIVTILLFQLAGEIAARGLNLPLPGPVIGMIALVGALIARPGLMRIVGPVADMLLSHLSLLFVPAGVGVIAHWAVLRDQGLAVAAALIVSTIAAIAVGAFVFQTVARRMGVSDE